MRRERRPSASISDAAAATSCGRRELETTSAPAAARPRAIARPKPVVPPATTATLPVRSNKDWRIEEMLSQIRLQGFGRVRKATKRSRFSQNNLDKKPDGFADFLSIQMIT